MNTLKILGAMKLSRQWRKREMSDPYKSVLNFYGYVLLGFAVVFVCFMALATATDMSKHRSQEYTACVEFHKPKECKT